MKLNLGAGKHRVGGFTNVDIEPTVEPDIIADLTQTWPFKDDSVDEIIAKDIFEHLPDQIFTMNEAYRVLKPGGILHVYVPTTDSLAAFADPTHVSYWNANSFLYFAEGSELAYPSIRARFQILVAKQYVYVDIPDSRGLYVQLKKPEVKTEENNE